MQKHCKNCNSLIPIKAKFCSDCGAKQLIDKNLSINSDNNILSNVLQISIKRYISILVFGRNTNCPRIWVWQENGKECSKDMGYTWNNRPYMKADTNNNCWKFDISEDFFVENIPFNIILDDENPIRI